MGRYKLILHNMNYTEKFNELRNILNMIIENNDTVRALWKTSTDKKYNYWITEPEFAEVIANIIETKSTQSPVNFLDLGAGAGFMFEMMPRAKNITYLGYEIEDALIAISDTFPNTIIKKDVITLTREDISQANILYFYEPIKCVEDSNSFALRLSQITNSTQNILYHCGGQNMKPALQNHFYLDNIYNDELFSLTKK